MIKKEKQYCHKRNGVDTNGGTEKLPDHGSIIFQLFFQIVETNQINQIEMLNSIAA